MNPLDPFGPVNYATDKLFPNPAKGAMGYLDKIPGAIKPYYEPYTQAGKDIIPGYEDMTKMLMSDPSGFLNKMGSMYQKSPGYDWNMKQGLAAIGNANAAGGMAGTPQHEQQSAEMANGLASKDYGDFMQRIMQALGIGMNGASDIFKTGASSSSDLAGNIAQALSGQAGLQYAGQANQNNLKGDLISGIAKMFGGGGFGG